MQKGREVRHNSPGSVLAILRLCHQGDTQLQPEAWIHHPYLCREHLSLVNLHFLSMSEEKQTHKRIRSHLTSFLINHILKSVCLYAGTLKGAQDDELRKTSKHCHPSSSHDVELNGRVMLRIKSKKVALKQKEWLRKHTKTHA